MRSNHEAGTAIDEMSEALLFTGRFGMEVEDNGIRLLFQRAGSQNVFC